MNLDFQLLESGAWVSQDIALRGIVPGKIVERHLEDYVFTFLQRGLYDMQQIAFGTGVRVLADGETLFVGLVTDADRTLTMSGEGITYKCESWWRALSLFTLKVSEIPRVAYNARLDDWQHDSARFEMTVEGILTDAAGLVSADISSYCLAKWGLAWPGFVFNASLDVTPPKMAFESANLQQVIRECLKWMPDAFVEIDRATGAFTFDRRSNTTVHNLQLQNWDTPAGGVPVNYVKMKPRVDLVIPRVKLYFPDRQEKLEGYKDASVTMPDYLAGVPQTVTKLTDLEFQVSQHPVYQLIEIVNGGQYNFSLSTGIITFKEHPTDFYVRYIAEASQLTYDTGLGGTGYSDYGIEVPVYERYLGEFAKLTRNFLVQGVDPTTPTWIYSPHFAGTFPDSGMWARLIGKTVTIAGRGSSTIAEVAIRTFTFTGTEATVIGQILGLSVNAGALAVSAIGMRLASAISGAARNDIIQIVVEDTTAAVTQLAEAFWYATRDVHWSGELPAIKWLPELKIGHRVNCLNTNDAAMATMNEVIVGLAFDVEREKTEITLASSPWTDLDTLLGVIREKMPPENVQNVSNPGGNSKQASTGGGGDMAKHKHNADTDAAGGNDLQPLKIAMNGATATDNEIRVGETATGVKISATGLVVGNYPSGNYARITANGFEFVYGGKQIAIGNVDSALDVVIDGTKYMFTSGTTRMLAAKVKS